MDNSNQSVPPAPVKKKSCDSFKKRCLFFTDLDSMVDERIKIDNEVRKLNKTSNWFFNNHNIKTKKINKVLQGSPHIVEMINEKKISLVFNTTETPQAIKDSKSIRRSALETETPYYTTVSGANAAVMAIKAINNNKITIRTIQSFGNLLS